LVANRKASPFSYRRAAAVGGNYETGCDALTGNNHRRFGAWLDVLDAHSAAHFRAGVFRSREQCFLHNLVREGK
jgi:hypothetical protein